MSAARAPLDDIISYSASEDAINSYTYRRAGVDIDAGAALVVGDELFAALVTLIANHRVPPIPCSATVTFPA